MANWGNIFSRGNVEDRRSLAPAVGGGISITGLALLLLFNYLSGGDLTDVVSQLDTVPMQNVAGIDTSAFEGEDSYEVFASKVLGSNNQMWQRVFVQNNNKYEEPKLVLFRAATESGCGFASSEVGPHYCPEDKTIYLDETFFEELQRRFGAKGGDVAEAYVISHEVGHHVQNELGILQRSGSSNEESVKTELQADCFAGLWVNSIKDQNVLDPGEVIEAMDAAASVGDDRIQKRVSGYLDPESWTHGSSDQRESWFKRGYETGDFSTCDTFR